MKRNDLIKALKMVLPGVDQRNVLLEGSDSFVFDNDWIKTFNDNLSVSYPFKSGLKCMARADILFKTLSKMEGEEIGIKAQDEMLIINDQTTELVLPLVEDKISPYIDNFQLSKIEWLDLPSDFLTGMSLCFSSAAKDSLFGAINSIYISDGTILTSDNFRVSKYIMNSPMKGTFVVPLPGAKELLSLTTLSHYSSDNSWIHFKNPEGLIFSMKLMLVDYPEEGLNKIISGLEFKNKFSFPDKIIECLDRVALLAIEDETLDYVLVSSKKGTLYISGERQYGRIEDKIPLPKNTFPEKLELKVSPKFLNSILSRSKDFFLHNNLIVFQSDNYTHVISTII